MSVSGLKAELKFLASIFHKNHERFRIVSWKLDELHCQFLARPPGSPAPAPPLTLHCNITVRRGPAGAGTGARAGPGQRRQAAAARGSVAGGAASASPGWAAAPSRPCRRRGEGGDGRRRDGDGGRAEPRARRGSGSTLGSPSGRAQSRSTLS